MNNINEHEMSKHNINALQIMNQTSANPNNQSRRLLAVAVLIVASACHNSLAWPRYNDAGEGGGCSDCHGAFTGTNSPKGTVFPMNSKHTMHRGNNYMNTDCDLCHSSNDNDNPFTYTSNGTVNNPGLGCSGCHLPEGLRAHHAANGITECAGCHTDDGPPAPENAKPPYYGTPDTRADNPCNGVAAANTNENWSVGDFLGLDNDGNNLYDTADFACGPPYQILQITREASNIRITWRTAGGRKDVIQASALVSGNYTNVSSTVTNTGTGILTTNIVEASGATKGPTRFYRVKNVP